MNWRFSAPLIMSSNYGYFTGIQVQNVGGSNCNSVSIVYGPNTAGSFSPTNETFSLAAGASYTSAQYGGQWASRYVGSAVISGSGCSLAVMVNEVSTSGIGDTLATYNALKY